MALCFSHAFYAFFRLRPYVPFHAPSIDVPLSPLFLPVKGALVLLASVAKRVIEDGFVDASGVEASSRIDIGDDGAGGAKE